MILRDQAKVFTMSSTLIDWPRFRTSVDLLKLNYKSCAVLFGVHSLLNAITWDIEWDRTILIP